MKIIKLNNKSAGKFVKYIPILNLFDPNFVEDNYHSKYNFKDHDDADRNFEWKFNKLKNEWERVKKSPKKEKIVPKKNIPLKEPAKPPLRTTEHKVV